jgi:hypothetical protein
MSDQTSLSEAASIARQARLAALEYVNNYYIIWCGTLADEG